MLCASKSDLFPPAVSRTIGVTSIFAAALACALILVPAASANARVTGTGLRTVSYGRPAPDFVYDEGAGPHHLADLAGRPVVINFWATWCVPCRDELEVFRALRSTYGNAVSLVTITDESAADVNAFLAKNELDFPVVNDPERKIFDAYGITPIPTTIVLGPSLHVAFVSIGELSWPELHGAIDGTLYPQSIREPT